jgi:hypothetical protein
VEDERRLINGVGRSKQDEKQIETTDGLGSAPVDISVHTMIEETQI